MDDLCRNCKYAVWDYFEYNNTRQTVSFVEDCKKGLCPVDGDCEGYKEYKE